MLQSFKCESDEYGDYYDQILLYTPLINSSFNSSESFSELRFVRLRGSTVDGDCADLCRRPSLFDDEASSALRRSMSATNCAKERKRTSA